MPGYDFYNVRRWRKVPRYGQESKRPPEVSRDHREGAGGQSQVTSDEACPIWLFRTVLAVARVAEAGNDIAGRAAVFAVGQMIVDGGDMNIDVGMGVL